MAVKKHRSVLLDNESICKTYRGRLGTTWRKSYFWIMHSGFPEVKSWFWRLSLSMVKLQWKRPRQKQNAD